MSNIRTQKLRVKLKKAAGLKRSVLRDAFEFFRRITPRRTGNARRNTKLTRHGIHADYSYAEVLDRGRHRTPRGMRGSLQAPEGMTTPTVREFRQWIKKYIKRGQ